MENDYEYETIKNPDSTYVKALKKRLKANNGYCLNQQPKSPETKCPCKYHADTGECLCGLWIRVPC